MSPASQSSPDAAPDFSVPASSVPASSVPASSVPASTVPALAERPGSNYQRLGVIAAVTIAAAAAILLLCSLSWLTLSVNRLPPFAPVHVAVKGRQLFPALTGLAVVALLIAVLSFVTGKWGRRIVAVMLTLTGLSCAAYGIRGLSAPGPHRVMELLPAQAAGRGGFIETQRSLVLPAAVLSCSIVLVLAGVALFALASRFSTGLSTRYSAPSQAARAFDPWRSLDRGEDPTLDNG